MRRILITTVAVAMTAAAPALAQDDAAPKTLTIGDPAPAIDISNWIKGDPVAEFTPGNVYVVEFWATWCGPCVSSMPHFSDLQEKYADYGVTCIGVSDEPLETVTGFLAKENRRDGLINNDRIRYTLTTDPDKSVKNDYFYAAGQRGIPCAFLVGKTGEIEWIGHPMRLDEPLEAVVKDNWDRDAFRVEREKEKERESAAQAFNESLRNAQRDGDMEKVISLLDDAIAKEPESLMYRYRKFLIQLTEIKDAEAAYETGKGLVELGKDDAMLLNRVAWLIVENKDVEIRNLDFALQVAYQAVEVSKAKNASILDTLARVYFEQGNFDKAIHWQQEAVNKAGDDGNADDIRATLDKYRASANR